MTDRKIPVVEVFGPTLQGEGALAGQPSHFLRLGYCDGPGRGPWCSWCDSMHAVDPRNRSAWEWLTPDEIVERVEVLPSWCRTLTITGGNPVLHDLTALVETLIMSLGLDLWVETQGTIYRDWLDLCNVTVSPKPPSAGTYDCWKYLAFMDRREQVDDNQIVLKVVCDPDDERDLAFVEEIQENTYRTGVFPPQYLSVVTYPADTVEDVIARWRRLTDIVLSGRFDQTWTVLPQLHVLLWGHEKGR